MMKKSLFVFLMVLSALSLVAQQSVGGVEVYNLDTAVQPDSDGVYRVNVAPGPFEHGADIERLIFFLGFTEGAPTLIITSPDGTSYDIFDDKIEYFFQDFGLVGSVILPEPGQWIFRIQNAPALNTYNLMVLGSDAAPTITMADPIQIGADTWRVSGQVTPPVEGQIEIRLSQESNSLAGTRQGMVELSSDGTFYLDIDTASFLEGDYYPSAIMDLSYTSGGLMVSSDLAVSVRHNDEVGPVTDWSAEIDEEGVLRARWENEFGQRVRGYSLEVYNKESQITTTQFLGITTELEIPGFSSTQGYRLTLITIPNTMRINQGDEAVDVSTSELRSPSKDLVLLELTGNSNTPVIAEIPEEITILTDEERVFSIELDISGWEESQSVRDWVSIGWENVPNGLYINTLNEGYEPLSTQGVLEFDVVANNDIAPGDYVIEGFVRNMGTGEQASFEWELWIRYPAVIIEELTPDAALINQTIDINIYGQHFYSGTRVFWDDMEIPLTEVFPDRITTELTTPSQPGDYELTVRNIHGDEATRTINVEDPGYILTGYKTRSSVMPGETTRFWWDLEAKEGFEGNLEFSLENLPSGWNAQFEDRILRAGELGALDISVPAGALQGPYNILLRDEQDYGFDLIIQVAGSQPSPWISGFYPYGVYEGEPVELLGYAFGDEPGTVVFGGKELNILSWGDEVVEVIIPWETKPGPIKIILPDGTESNFPYFPVKNYGFSLTLVEDYVSVEPGQEIEVPVAVLGYGAEVNLELTGLQDSIFSWRWSDDTVTPNAVSNLILEVLPTAKNGRHEAILSGVSGPYQSVAELNVVVGNAFEIMSDELPNAVQGGRYNFPVEYIHAKGDGVSFTLKDGRVPGGLKLTSQGTLEGIPMEVGVFNFTVSATDGIGQEDENLVTILVEESAWPGLSGDFGRSRYMPIDSSAEIVEAWELPGMFGDGKAIAGGGMIYLSARNALVGIEQETGEVAFQTPGIVADMAYHSGVVVVLETYGMLKGLNPYSGQALWRREGYEAMHIAGDKVFARKDGVFHEIMLSTGQLRLVHQSQFPDQILVVGDHLVSWANRQIKKWDGSNWNTIWTKGEAINNLAADSEYLLVITDNRNLYALNWDGVEIASMVLDSEAKDLSLGADRLLIWDQNQIEVLDRMDLSFITEWTGSGITQVAQSESKIIVVDRDGVHAINPYVGTSIWLDREGQDSLVLFKGLLAYQRRNESYVMITGEKNIEPPQTQIVLNPPQPLGQNNYYSDVTMLSFDVSDLETVGELTTYQFGDSSLQTYTGAIKLPEGSYTITARSQDTHGLTEPTRFLYVNVDNSDPVTTADFEARTGSSPLIFLEDIMITLEAQDTYSGVEQTQYRWNQGNWVDYRRPFRFANSGWNVLAVRSQDRAGRWEQEKTYRILIDKESPSVFAQQIQRGSLSFLYLIASDIYSEVDSIEFRLDGGEIQSYNGPQVFSDPGEFLLEYRATDTAGNVSQWYQDTILVKAEQGLSLVENISFYDDRSIEDPVLFGGKNSQLFSLALPEYNSVLETPQELEGGVQIQMSERDGFVSRLDFLKFTVSEDAEVHVIVPADSPVRWSQWEDRGAADLVEPYHYFQEGGIWYSRLFAAGAEVEIPGPALGRSGGYLLVANQVPSDLVWISPQRGEALHPGQKVNFSIFDRALEPGSWTLYRGEESWELESGMEAEFEIPESWSEGEVRVVYTRGEVSAESTFLLTDLSGFRLINPPAGASLLPGASFQVTWAYRGPDGIEVPGPALSWSLVGQGSETPIQTNGWGILPAKQGEYFLHGYSPSGELLAEFPLSVQVQAPWVEVPREQGSGSAWESNLLQGEQSSEGWRFGYEKDLVLHTGVGDFELELTAEEVEAWSLGYLDIGDTMGNVFVRERGGRAVITIRFNTQEPWVTLSGDFEMNISQIRWRRINYRQSAVEYRVTPMIGGDE